MISPEQKRKDLYWTAKELLETVAASDLKDGRCRQLIELMKIKIEAMQESVSTFRLSSHSLLIQTGHYTGIPTEERLCSFCNMRKIEDEFHLLLPRDHKAKVCVWADLTVDDIDRINESLNADHIKMVLSDIFHLDDHKSNLKTGIIMDLFYYTLQFARENSFTKEQTSAFFSIVKKTHEVCIETPFGNVDQTFNYFKEMVLCHAVNRPPHSIELFAPDQVRLVTEYTVNSYFRHFKMYKYAFTPLVRLDLSISYVGVPATPPPSEHEADSLSEQDSEQADTEQPLTPDTELLSESHIADEQADQTLEEEKEPEGEGAEGEEQPKTPEIEESPARKELRGMIQNFLTDEIKKLKMSVDDQLKTTEDLLNKKLDIAEGGPAKKGGKGSAKASKKK